MHCIGHTESITACDAGFKISIFNEFYLVLTANSIKTESEAKGMSASRVSLFSSMRAKEKLDE